MGAPFCWGALPQPAYCWPLPALPKRLNAGVLLGIVISSRRLVGPWSPRWCTPLGQVNALGRPRVPDRHRSPGRGGRDACDTLPQVAATPLQEIRYRGVTPLKVAKPPREETTRTLVNDGMAFTSAAVRSRTDQAPVVSTWAVPTSWPAAV